MEYPYVVPAITPMCVYHSAKEYQPDPADPIGKVRGQTEHYLEQVLWYRILDVSSSGVETVVAVTPLVLAGDVVPECSFEGLVVADLLYGSVQDPSVIRSFLLRCDLEDRSLGCPTPGKACSRELVGLTGGSLVTETEHVGHRVR